MASRITIIDQVKPFTTERAHLLQFCFVEYTDEAVSFKVKKCETGLEAVNIPQGAYMSSKITQFYPKDGVSILTTVHESAFSGSDLSGAVEILGDASLAKSAFSNTKITSIKIHSKIPGYQMCVGCELLQVAYFTQTALLTEDNPPFPSCPALKKIVAPSFEELSKFAIPWELDRSFRGTIVMTETTMEQARQIPGVSDLKYTDIECTDGTIHCE